MSSSNFESEFKRAEKLFGLNSHVPLSRSQNYANRNPSMQKSHNAGVQADWAGCEVTLKEPETEMMVLGMAWCWRDEPQCFCFGKDGCKRVRKLQLEDDKFSAGSVHLYPWWGWGKGSLALVFGFFQDCVLQNVMLKDWGLQNITSTAAKDLD